jgi:hypothetical protein
VAVAPGIFGPAGRAAMGPTVGAMVVVLGGAAGAAACSPPGRVLLAQPARAITMMAARDEPSQERRNNVDR